MNGKKPKLLVILHTVFAAFLMVALTCTVLYASDLLTGELNRKEYPEGIVPLPEQLRALTIYTRGNQDFPSAPNLSAKTLREELDQIVSFASTYGFNAIFFEAVPECDAFYQSSVLPSSTYWTGQQGRFTFFDPLGYLVNQAKLENLQVYALLNPFRLSQEVSTSSPAVQHSDWVVNGILDPLNPDVQRFVGSVVKELALHYDIAGVIFEELDGKDTSLSGYPEAVTHTLERAHAALRDTQQQRIGMLADSRMLASPSQVDLASDPMQQGILQFVVPVADEELPPDELGAQFDGWAALCKRLKTAYYPSFRVNDNNLFAHQIDNSLFLSEDKASFGVAVSDYHGLNTRDRTAAFSLAATFVQQPLKLPNLHYPTSFQVTRPTQTLKVSAATTKYFVTGTSNPGEPLTLNGREITRKSNNGLWGVLVDVYAGENSYQFRQGNTTKTVTISREMEDTPNRISALVKSSLYPQYSEAVLNGSMLMLSCTAPAGGKVTASIGGLSAELDPVEEAERGTAVTYQRALDLTTLTSYGQIKRIGKVTYRLSYNGLSSTQQSDGEVYACGAGSRPIAQMNAFMVPISKNGLDDGVYTTLLKQGCVDYIVGNLGSYYQLSSGGYVLKAAANIPEGQPSAQNILSHISAETTAKGEKLILSGTVQPYFTGDLTNDSLTITLSNTDQAQAFDTQLPPSTLYEELHIQGNEDGSLTLKFQLLQGVKLLGWDVQFDGSNTILYLKRYPQLHPETAKPLSELTIVLDPGHGGTDPGAAGVPGTSGPLESSFNLANAYALRNRLEALGATVYLTHENDTLSLNGRLQLAQEYDADLFLSCHHNSLSESADANTVSGVEAYYYTDASKRLADLASANLAGDTGRDLRFTEQSWYRVTMMTACPAILLESGYLCNPVEYEQLASEYSMYLYGNAVADAVVEYFR
ncbi:MAG: family 10 glycosylhydrolase [Anaerotruncus sp.]|nr:family 10 glycosylhydrolase [Anaerotruncus sp.]